MTERIEGAILRIAPSPLKFPYQVIHQGAQVDTLFHPPFNVSVLRLPS